MMTRVAPRRAWRWPAGVHVWLRGVGHPRLRPSAWLRALAWSALIWALYAYALDIARWEGTVRLFGLALLAVVGIATLRALAAYRLALRHLGLLPLGMLLLVVGLALTFTRGQAAGAASSLEWRDAAGSVAWDGRRGLSAGFTTIVAVPSQVYLAATARPLPWQEGAATKTQPLALAHAAPAGQVEPRDTRAETSLKPGALVRVAAPSGGIVRLQATPSEAAVVATLPGPVFATVIEGPREFGGERWWRVWTAAGEGWCSGVLLTPVAR